MRNEVLNKVNGLTTRMREVAENIQTREMILDDIASYQEKRDRAEIEQGKDFSFWKYADAHPHLELTKETRRAYLDRHLQVMQDDIQQLRKLIDREGM